jgi:hypothetical protein
LQYFVVVKIWTSVELYSVLIVADQTSSLPIGGDGAISMTMQFVDGFLAAMLPSIITVAWLVWRAA